MHVLKAMYDGSSYSESLQTSEHLGVFMTGMMEKFQGVTIATVPNQLFKLRHNGGLISGFVPPIFGPATFVLKENIVSGADETHYQKIMCATPSAGGNSLYVGGKFTDLDGTEVGHICCIDINTGALQ